MYKIWAIGFLLICAFSDLKEMKVYSKVCVFHLMAAGIVHSACRDMAGRTFFFVAAMGGLFWIISIITKDALGKGDALVIVTVGAISGMTFLISTMILGFFLCSLFSLAVLLSGKAKMCSSIPLIPFLLIGAVLSYFF